MLFVKSHSIVVYLLTLSFCSAVKFLPRAHHAAIGLQDFAQQYEVTFNTSDRPKQLPSPRLMIPTLPPQEPLANTESAAAIVKRTLLGNRQTCNPGFGYCSETGRCCPFGSGCCDTGHCATSSQSCCSRGPCSVEEVCCADGCHPKGSTCCPGGKSCGPDQICCSDGTCAPVGSQCCIGGRFCNAGTMCVLYNGELVCCRDLSCSETRGLGDGGTSSDADNVDEDSAPSAFTTTITTRTFTPLSITPRPLPTSEPRPDINIRHYTTTWVWYYYSYYLTWSVIYRESRTTTFVTSDRVSTTTTVTVEATATVDAERMFRSLSAEATFPTATTDPAVARYTATRSTATRSTSTRSTETRETNLPFGSNVFTSGVVQEPRWMRWINIVVVGVTMLIILVMKLSSV